MASLAARGKLALSSEQQITLSFLGFNNLLNHVDRGKYFRIALTHNCANGLPDGPPTCSIWHEITP